MLRCEFPSSGCWLWLGSKDTTGYASAFVDGHTRTVHRLAFELANGPIPKGVGTAISVMHRCDVRHCVNPNHMVLATHAENMMDALKKGRFAIGERVGCAKLTKDKVVQMRTLFESGVSKKDLAVKFSVSDRTVRAVVKREVWKHVP